MNLLTRAPLVLVGALMFALAACSPEGAAGPGSANMTVVLRRGSNGPTLSETGQPSGTRTFAAAAAATPASCPFQAAAVTIDEIYLQGEGGRTTLRSTPATVDLCDLGTQALILVQDVPVPAGSYQEIRFVISGGYVQDAGSGTVYATEGYQLPAGVPAATATLQTPSWGSSGLKVNFDHGPVTIDGEQKVIALDLDLARSFGQEAGGSSQWVMSPVINAADISFTGSVRVRLELGSGVTLPAIEGTPVTFSQFAAIATLGSAAETQAFDPVLGETILFLSPQSAAYTITLGIPGALDVTATPESHAVTISEGVASPSVTFTVNAVGVAAAPTEPDNLRPSATFTSPAKPSFAATVGVPVQFNPSGTFDPEGAWVGSWDFGDGQTFTGTFGSLASHIVSHTYAGAGTYTVTWTVQDEQGASATATTSAVVTEP